MVINDDTKRVQIIPEGEKNPNAEIETGAVNETALTEADNERDIFSGKIFIKIEFVKPDKNRIPASAP